jgi:uncharacterized protein (DUF885 family)
MYGLDPARTDALLATKARESDAARLRRLFDETWDYTMREYPEYATWFGYPGQNARWTDLSEDAIERRRHELANPDRVLRSIDRAALSAAERLDYDLFRRVVDEALEGLRFRTEYMPLSQMEGVQQNAAQLVTMMPATSRAEYEDVVARLEGLPAVVDQTIGLLGRGLEQGLTPPRITLRDVPQQVRNQVVDDARRSPFLAPFAKAPEGMDAGAHARLASQATAAYERGIRPAFQRLLAYLEERYIPNTRESIAAAALPDGEAYYAYRIRQMTTTDMSAREIHEVGKREVARIRAAMDAVIAETGFTGGFGAFVDFLRTDPRFFFEKPEDLLVAYRDICKRADPELPRLFGTLPRLPYGVVAVPAYAEKSQTTAYYEPGSPRAGRPGNFFANTYDLKARPRWEMEALSLHEAVPGHHLQIALAQELPEMPEFRKNAFYTAYIEGWGLYAESLGREMGFYKDPYARFGQLTYEIWRAIRLVVDTGMHALGWSRQQAIDYFVENAGKAEHDIVVEIDRYIVWPGQALAYKIGELKIQELRARARTALGERFDVRAFHDVVLGAGALPLDVLEARVDAWIAARPAQAGAASDSTKPSTPPRS